VPAGGGQGPARRRHLGGGAADPGVEVRAGDVRRLCGGLSTIVGANGQGESTPWPCLFMGGQPEVVNRPAALRRPSAEV